MNYPKQLIFLLSSIALFSLGGCESISPSECRMADWSQRGYTDGQNGESKSLFNNYVEDCSKVSIRPNAIEYWRGWNAGIVQFCTPRNGWSQGRQGMSSKGSACQGQAGETQFVYYFKAGMDTYRTEQQIGSNTQKINQQQKRLLEAGTPDGERSRIREDLRRLDGEQYRLRDLLSQQQRYAP